MIIEPNADFCENTPLGSIASRHAGSGRDLEGIFDDSCARPRNRNEPGWHGSVRRHPAEPRRPP